MWSFYIVGRAIIDKATNVKERMELVVGTTMVIACSLITAATVLCGTVRSGRSRRAIARIIHGRFATEFSGSGAGTSRNVLTVRHPWFRGIGGVLYSCLVSRGTRTVRCAGSRYIYAKHVIIIGGSCWSHHSSSLRRSRICRRRQLRLYPRQPGWPCLGYQHAPLQCCQRAAL